MFSIPAPVLQLDFSVALTNIRGLYLQDALAKAVRTLDVTEIDRALATLVPRDSLATLASCGLRGELMFPLPLVLNSNPRLLGYYRLLYGFSQKEFYTSATGVSRFKSMEQSGRVTEENRKDLAALCKALSGAGVFLLDGLGAGRISRARLDDLTLLTLGPQLRGGANVKKGIIGIVHVFEVIHDIVRRAVRNSTEKSIEIKNAAGRRVFIEFAADPDIIIQEEMSDAQFRKLIAIEVKGGSDFSNIHNRIGEAEKSHQKARSSGYVECWTVVNVDRIDIEMARKESPSTNRFYRISDLIKAEGAEYDDFRRRVISLTGIRS